ncbi:MAG: MBL fold metallo-hydrolase [Planctomycetes bacterium]|nr:MBL fold metallo-hydrolase [Planctomycetota bacterium]
MSATPPTTPAARRAASALVLYRRERGRIEVFLVERAAELRFFGGYHALPGGVRGKEDGPDERGNAGPGLDGEPDLPPLARCAERELFEETGVLLDPGLRTRLAASERDAVRTELLAGAEGATRWSSLRPQALRADVLAPLCRICTPPFAPVRYDTVFFLAELPQGEQPLVLPGELVGGRFMAPSEALAAWRRGEILIVPPVLILLELLRDGDLAAFASRARAIADRYESGFLHHVRFSPGVVMASVRSPTLPPATTTNCLLVGEERLWIVDPATPDRDEQERLFALIDDLVADGRVPAGIAVTHHHQDHVGAVVATSRRYGLAVRGHPLTLDRLEPGFVRGEPLRDGDRVPLGVAPDGSADWELVARATPGHDRGHLCFRETRYDATFVGDMLSTVSTIVIDPPEGHLRTYLHSLERMLGDPMSTLYPAHGPAMRDGHRLIRQYLRHRRQREATLLEALENGPATLRELVAKVYWDTDARMFPLAERSLLAGLDKLAEDGVARDCDDGRWCRA